MGRTAHLSVHLGIFVFNTTCNRKAYVRYGQQTSRKLLRKNG